MISENYTNISFPALNLEVNPPRSINLPGGLSFNLYGLVIALGLILAVVYGLKRRKQFGLLENDILDGVLGIVPFAVICARLYYCAFKWDVFSADPIRILYIWEGGLAIYGGVIGAAIGVIVLCLIKKIKLPAVLDLVALGFLIGQCIGRWGNFFNREAVGVLKEGSQIFTRMGLLNKYTGQYEYVHPTFLYESLWNLVGFIGLHFLSKKRKYDGQIALGYVAWYGLGRTFIEGLREDSLYLGGFRISQLIAAVSCLIAVAVLLFNLFRYHDPKKLYGYANAEAIAAEEAKKTAKKDENAVLLDVIQEEVELSEAEGIEEDAEEDASAQDAPAEEAESEDK